MNKTILALTIAALTSPAFAADMEDSKKVEVDKSHNYVTGSDTVTKTTKVKKKGAKGKGEVEITEKTKTMPSGKVEKSKEVEADEKSESH